MEFFNRKEEVIDIQLTQEGKRLLSKGEFIPYYYEFFDDDILYDTNGSGFSELQNESIPRIKETPRIKTQAITYGIETELKRQTDSITKLYGITGSLEIEKFKKKIPYNKNHDSLKYALGLGDYSSDFVPSWNLSLISGLIQTGSFSTTYSPENDYYEYIPQINCSCSYVYQARNDFDNFEDVESENTTDDNIIFKSDLFEDKSYYVIREQNNLSFTLKEVNSVFDKENFDIEIFEVETVEGQKENLKQLFFLEDVVNFENFYQDFTPLAKEEILPCDVEWYFSLMKDEGVEEPVSIINPYMDENADDSQEPC